MSKYPKLTAYVSEIDKFLKNFDQQHPSLSLSQQLEIDKFKRIYSSRDSSIQPRQDAPLTVWDAF